MVRLDSHRGEAEVCFELLPVAWGQGLATEALSALVGWIWAEHRHGSLIAVTQVANTSSCALLERVGFRVERELEEWGETQAWYRLDRPRAV